MSNRSRTIGPRLHAFLRQARRFDREINLLYQANPARDETRRDTRALLTAVRRARRSLDIHPPLPAVSPEALLNQRMLTLARQRLVGIELKACRLRRRAPRRRFRALLRFWEAARRPVWRFLSWLNYPLVRVSIAE
jgi:hypothetical protein